MADEGPGPRPANDQVAALVDLGSLTELRDRIPFAARLGVELLDASPSSVKARLDWDPELCTADREALHGGALMGLADVCGGLCAGLNLPAGSVGTTTIQSTINFLRAVRSGPLEALTEPLHIGRTTIVVQTDLMDGGGRRAGRIIQTQAVLWPRPV